MTHNRRRIFLMLSMLLFIAATTTVAAGTHSSVRRRKQSSKKIRGRSRITQQHDSRILALPPDWDLDDRQEWDFRALKKDDESPSKKIPLVPQEPAKETKSPKTEPDDIDVDDNIDDDQEFQDIYQLSPSEQPSLSPTSSPPTLEPSQMKAAVTYETSMEQEAKSRATSSGMTVGFAVSGMGLVFVLLFFAQRKKRRRKLMTAKEVEKGELAIEDGVVDDDEDEGGAFTGVYKLRENSNLNEFMEAIGVSWAVRSATVRARPIHYITHEGNEITMKFKGIPRATYIIDGPAVKNVLVSSTFACKASYTEDNHGFEVRKEGVDQDDYNIHLRWSLADDNETVRMTMAALFKDEDKEPVECTQIYKRIGEF